MLLTPDLPICNRDGFCLPHIDKFFFGNCILCIYWPVALNTNFQWAGWCADVKCIQLSYITTLFPLGKCDPGCNNAACEWDGLDCDQQELPDLAKGELILVIDMTPEVFLNQSESFLRTTSRLLKAKVEFKLAPDGLPMVCYSTGTMLSFCALSLLFLTEQ